MKIAVVGAGIFGTTTAIKLAEKGFKVELFEKESDIMMGASGANQFRLHIGYHYPRSDETAISSRDAEISFKKEYKDSVVTDNEHYYCIASQGSKVTGKQFMDFCKRCDLDFEIADLPYHKKDKIDLLVKVKESIIDYPKLKETVRERLIKNKVKIYTDTIFSYGSSDHDYIINCTYASLNSVIEDKKNHKEYQFEVCEKPLIKLPDEYRKKSIVVLDGPFFCIDPFGRTDLHFMGNVVHAIHSTNNGYYPKIPKKIIPLLNKGLIKNPPVTNIKKFLKSASEIIPDMAKAEHIGSMYTIRTVLPNKDKTDERPTVVNRLNKRLIQVFSGKIGNCVQAAKDVLNLLKKK